MASRRLALAALSVVLIAACAAPANDGVRDDDLTSIESTSVKRQAIGDCWLYATAGWVESLHKNATGHDVDVSEAYWSYWYWYEQIAGDDIAQLRDPRSVTDGGVWGIAAELAARYGWMNERDFIPDVDADAQRARDALRSINASLATGALASAEERRDRTLVRAELDRAWRLPADVVRAMNAAFPAEVLPRTLPPMIERAAASGPIHAPQELSAPSASGHAIVTLADALGRKTEGEWAASGKRSGDEAWSEIAYDWSESDRTRRRAILQNVQDALHRRVAVPIVWTVGKPKDGVFRGVESNHPVGAHVSLIVDYEVDHVPGFGSMVVDVRETRAEALEAALASEAAVTLLRIKNSWGTGPLRDGDDVNDYLPAKPGFNDLYLDYLDLPRSSNSARAHLLEKIALPRTLRFSIPDGG